MLVHHKGLAPERWFKFSLMEQLSNVGTDVERVIQWKKKGNLEYSRMAFERSLELLDLTISDPKNRKRLKEVLRVREALVDYFVYNNEYSTSDKFWHAAAIARGK